MLNEKESLFKTIVMICAILGAVFVVGILNGQAGQTLTASWYSVESLKKEGTFAYSKGIMANGKEFKDENKTCATRLYALGTVLKIMHNGKFVVCVVTDRIGKRFAKTRVDLSRSTFAVLAPLSRGIIPVEVKVIDK